ncbi:MAG: sensor histidine kinase [Ekhidna sp.]
MNLVARITILFVFVSLIVFLIGGFISLDIMIREVDFEQRRFLIERLDRAERLIERRNPTDSIKWRKMVVIPLDEYKEESQMFSDTLVMHSQLERLEPHLKLDVIKNINGKSYLISLYDIIIEKDDIIDGLVESLVTMYLILLAAVLIIGFFASYFILKPFNNTLSIIRNFSLSSSEGDMKFPKSRVSEFKRLNQFLTEMTDKVRSDYQSLKEFSENASHELQTPLAIVQGKMEVLMDADNLTEEQINQVNSAQNTIRRLSNLSSSLSLLTKIDNNEFRNVTNVNLSKTITLMVEEFKELLSLKSIEMKIEIEKEVFTKVDDVLIELLLTNLLNNAIRHNSEKGNITLKLTKDSLIISNTGPAIEGNPSELFQRFKKSNQSSNSMGLGLAIVKRVCDLYQYSISYKYSEKLHSVKVDFHKTSELL